MRSFNDKLVKKIALAPRVFFFFDYDGTLTPIVSKPARAVLKKATRSVLRRLSCFPGVKIAVVSGRSLKDLQDMVGPILEIIYVGNHGLELKGQDFGWSHPSVRQISKMMERIWQRLKRKLRPVKGMLLENKTIGISLHYRLVAEGKVADLHRDFQKILNPWIRLGKVNIQDGKKVWEVRPKTLLWNKGRVVQWLLRKFRRQGSFLPVFIGDDRTDEDAFKTLQSSGLTVKVTGNPRALSKAKFYIHSPDEVCAFMEQVVKIRGAGLKEAGHVRSQPLV